jgi:hypothetical protein
MSVAADIRVSPPPLRVGTPMATFYVLPPRASLERVVGELLGQLLPGLPLPADSWDVIADRLGSSGHWPDDVYLVPRDDLPEGESLAQALTAAFGAEPGDRVIEINGRKGPAIPRVWVLSQADVSSTAIAQ